MTLVMFVSRKEKQQAQYSVDRNNKKLSKNVIGILQIQRTETGTYVMVTNFLADSVSFSSFVTQILKKANYPNQNINKHPHWIKIY